MYRLALLVFCLVFAITGIRPVQAQPNVVVWDPVKGTGERRFTLSPDHMDQVASWLAQAGIKITRLTAEALADKNTFSAKQYDALFMDGLTVPSVAIKAMQQFADDGGIMVNMGSGVPFLVKIKQKPDETWTMDPPTPRFAWQTNDINRHLGIKYYYDVKRHNQGVIHTLTPLFEKYFKDTGKVKLPEGMLPSAWTIPNSDRHETARYYPLVRSQRVDQLDVIPQLFISRFHDRLSIHAIAPYFTGKEKADWWPAAEQTIVAIAHMAYDLKNKNINLDDYLSIGIDRNMPSPKPLRSRRAIGDVQPATGTVVATWGKFNGVSHELGEPVNSIIDRPTNILPQELGPGASIQLQLPNNATQATHLRYRIAYNKDASGLCIAVGKHILLNELFVYLDTGDGGNFSAPSYVEKPIEMHRLAYLPAEIWEGNQTITLSNPGTEPIYFDAIQLETAPTPRDWRIGLGGPWRHRRTSPKPNVSTKYTKTWPNMRTGAGASYVGPPSDPDRFKIMDEAIEESLAINDNLEVNLQGTQEWNAIPKRWKEANDMKRPYAAAADAQKYQQVIEHLVTKYGDRIDTYELWNEADSQMYWRGSVEEYIAWCHATIDTIRRLDPTARILTTGMAGFKAKFIHELKHGGVMDRVDAMAFHPYAGKAPLWDLPCGLAEGELMAMGLNLPIYPNEMGFVFRNAEWFTAPPVFTPDLQAQMTSIAISRLISNDISELCIFHAGGSKHYYGLIDENSVPRPAYHVYEDYMQLSLRGGKRIELSLTPASHTDAPIKGIFAAAAKHDDGSYTVMLNPSQCDFHKRFVRVIIPVASDVTKLNSSVEQAEVKIKRDNNQSWAELTIPLIDRTRIELKP
ncbi:MAG: hypothetical protein ACF8OB_05040 [Phycisphaeraceae bacterium JB051]